MAYVMADERATNKDFWIGYIHGLEASGVNSRDAFDPESYYRGYVFGCDERFKETFIIPDWMTPEQATAVKRIYARQYVGFATRAEFFTKVEDFGDYCGLTWCGMFIGIEPDGYTHT
jgi:hypothetical protein